MIAFLVGFVSFLLAGFGLGGGVLLIPLITFIFPLDQADAKYIALIAYLPAAIGVIISCILEKKTEFAKIVSIIPIGILGSVSGTVISNNIETAFLKKIYSLFLICVGIYMSLNTIFFIKKRQKRKF